MVRKASKEHGTKKEFEGDLNRGDRVLFVEDVVTSGGTLRGAIERLRGHGAVIEDCVCVVDREEGGKLLLAEISVRLHALLASKDLLDRAQTAVRALSATSPQRPCVPPRFRCA